MSAVKWYFTMNFTDAESKPSKFQLRMLTGKERFVMDRKILSEGYKHHTP